MLTIGRGALALAGLGLAWTAVPAMGQSDADARLKKIEAEVRALQRQVFPNGAGKTFEPEITGAQPVAQPIGAPSTTAVTDILARLDALEGQLRQLTAGNEENANTLRLLQDRVRLIEGAGQAGVTATPSPSPSLTPTPTAAAQTPARGAAPRPATAAPTGPTAERLAAVQAIVKPDTGDAGADDYAYGFRLWEAKFYPEAAQQLTMFVDKYPSHAQISYGRNLLGRAYLDDG